MLLLVVVLLGCAGLSESAAYADADAYAPGGAEGYALAERDVMPSPEAAPASTRALGAGDGTSGLFLATDEETTSPTTPAQTGDATETPSAERMRVFSANLELSVPAVGTARDQIIDLVEGTGGYVESSNDTYLVVRVPAESFDQSLSAIEGLGDVLSRAVSTADVTDQYQDLQRRLQIVEVSLDRLHQLLERATDPDERVAILRDIRRLTEEKEQLTSAMTSLSRLVRYSRITIRLIARIQTTETALMRIPFAWIASLDPLYATLGEASRPITIDVPEDFAVFAESSSVRAESSSVRAESSSVRAESSSVRAESADGVRLRISGRRNEPAGSAQFWQEALLYHLGPLYQVAEPVETGDFMGVRLVSKDTEPFVFVVTVAVRDDELLVAEVFYPDRTAESAHEAELMSALEGAR
jgi:hypothetical protein